MNKILTQLEATCLEIQAKIASQKKGEEWFGAHDETVKRNETEVIKDCCILLAKFMQDCGMKEVEVVEAPTLERYVH